MFIHQSYNPLLTTIFVTIAAITGLLVTNHVTELNGVHETYLGSMEKSFSKHCWRRCGGKTNHLTNINGKLKLIMTCHNDLDCSDAISDTTHSNVKVSAVILTGMLLNCYAQRMKSSKFKPFMGPNSPDVFWNCIRLPPPKNKQNHLRGKESLPMLICKCLIMMGKSSNDRLEFIQHPQENRAMTKGRMTPSVQNSCVSMFDRRHWLVYVQIFS